MKAWTEVNGRNGRRRVFAGVSEGRRPGIGPGLGGARKGVAARFFQLASGHALTATFLEEKWEWTDSDNC